MRKYLYAALLVLALAALLISCNEERERHDADSRLAETKILIVTAKGEANEKAAELISDQLCTLGCKAYVLSGTGADTDSYSAAVYVGHEPDGDPGIPHVTCTLAPPDEAEISKWDIFPFISPRDMARAALLLLPEADDFSVISKEAGAQDVQGACDLLDLCGVDYTVEILGKRSSDEVICESAAGGCDVILLPFEDEKAGVIETAGIGCALITVNGSAPAEGCLATFCTDLERIAETAAARAYGLATGKDRAQKSDSFYTLYIDRALAKDFGADIEAVAEDYRVAFVGSDIRTFRCK